MKKKKIKEAKKLSSRQPKHLQELTSTRTDCRINLLSYPIQTRSEISDSNLNQQKQIHQEQNDSTDDKTTRMNQQHARIKSREHLLELRTRLITQINCTI